MKPDVVRVHHMLDAAYEILKFMEGKSRHDLEEDRKLNLSVVHLLEIIGEAAAGTSTEFRENFPFLPWKAVVGMRNRLIHGYYDIDLDIVWKTIEEDIPPLIDALEKILESVKEE